MTGFKDRFRREPTIAVGLMQRAERVALRLLGDFVDGAGRVIAKGDYVASRVGGGVSLSGRGVHSAESMTLSPRDTATRFSVETTIGIDFHWEQRETQTFCGSLRLVPDGDGLTVINDVALETYLTAVICSEMSPTAPSDLTRAHAVISRSWLLAQMIAPPTPTTMSPERQGGSTREVIRWYDRQAHTLFDVCADDHCQRYQGVGKVTNERVFGDIAHTRGQVLVSGDTVCDARFSKCCGGVVEEFKTAWGNTDVPYLIPVVDRLGASMPSPPLTDERAFRAFVESRPEVYCGQADSDVIKRVLPDFDQRTRDFFRWQTRLTPAEAGELILAKSGIDVGDVRSMTPMERGPSGRLWKLRIEGTKGTLIVGKELEIRRVLSRSHLFSSAFVVDVEGPVESPEAFVLRGAGWGHGVGLCQIGAAVMACRGISYETILGHYYPNTDLVRIYQEA